MYRSSICQWLPALSGVTWMLARVLRHQFDPQVVDALLDVLAV